MNSVCGARATCTGVNSTCGEESLCSGVKSVCGSHSTCTGNGSKCGVNSTCSGLAECEWDVPAAVKILAITASLFVFLQLRKESLLLVRRGCRRIIVGKPKSSKLEQEDKDCPICLERLHLSEHCHVLACQHSFHVRCLDQWLRQHDTCPLCRQVANAAAKHSHFGAYFYRLSSRLRPSPVPAS